MQYSTTNGNSWLYITTIGSTINDIVAFNDSIFVATNTGVYKSSDKGQTWSATLPYNALCLHVAGGSLLCGTQAKGVWQSDPSGNIWFSKSVDLPFMASGDYKPVTSISMNDIYIMANVLYDTTAGPITFHTLYTMPVTELKAEHIAAVINDIQVYPNPATNEIFIDTDHLQGQNIRIALSDMQGSRILNRDYALQPTISLKLENIPQGTYILNISTGYNSISKKITITH